MGSKREVVYVKHPVAAELKQRLVSQGKKIIDARFAPSGSEIYGEQKRKVRQPKQDAE